MRQKSFSSMIGHVTGRRGSAFHFLMIRQCSHEQEYYNMTWETLKKDLKSMEDGL